MGTANNLKEEILIRREQRLKSLAKVSRQVCPRASSISQCDREIYYQITAWDKRPIPEPDLVARFEEGKEQEKKVIKELIDLGFEVVEGQKPFEIKDRKGRVVLTGSIDGMCLYKDKKVPFEVKSLDPNIYNSLENPGDFNKYDWAKRYPLQMQSYLFGNNQEEGLFIITDCKGHWKVFPISLDYELMEEILQRCEKVMDAVEKQNPPEFIKNASICRKCWALGRVCTPPLDFGEGVAIIDDPEIEMKLAKWNELKPVAKEFEELDKEIKAYFKGKPHSLCGDFEIIGEERIVKYKAQAEREVKMWITKIEKVNEIQSQNSD